MIESDDVDAVLVLTSMNEHGPLAMAGLAAGKHVLVEKPMATSLLEAAELRRGGDGRRRASSSARPTSCCRRPTGRCTRACTQARSVGCCSAEPATDGPARGGVEWFYQPGGGALFDLGVYNLTDACAASSARCSG